MNKKIRYSIFFKYLFSFFLIIFFISQIDFFNLLSTLSNFSYLCLLTVTAILLLCYLVSAYRWHLLLSKNYPFSLILKLVFIGQYYSVILPGQIAGEFVKAYRLGKGNIDAEKIAATVLFDRITGLVGLLVVSLVGFYLSKFQLPSMIAMVLFFITSLLIAGLFLLRFNYFYNLLMIFLDNIKIKKIHQFLGQLRRFIEAGHLLLHDLKIISYSFLLAIMFQILCIMISWYLAQNISIHLPFSDWCWILGVVSIAVLIPVTIGGIGLREGAYMGTLHLLGIPKEQALALSLAVFGLSLLGVAVGAVLEMNFSYTRKEKSSDF